MISDADSALIRIRQ